MKDLKAIVDALVSAKDGPWVLATLVSVAGSSYRRPGARLLVTDSGRRIGSISGGCLEEDVLARALTVAQTGSAEAITYDTTSENDLVFGVGLGCHGVVRVLLERVTERPAWAEVLRANFTARRATRLRVRHDGPEPTQFGTALDAPSSEVAKQPEPTTCFIEEVPPPVALFIYGAGDDAIPLTELARTLGWHLTLGDPRPAFATLERFPAVDSLVVASAADLVQRTAPGPDAVAVVMTHHYVHDLPILRDLLSRPTRYLGLLGPKKRTAKILEDLARDGHTVTDEQRRRLHAPVGLDLGAETPEQVALAIVAEIQAVLAGRDGRPLRDRTQPIHG